MPQALAKARRDRKHRISDIWQRVGINGALQGANGSDLRVFLTSLLGVGAVSSVIQIIHVITAYHVQPQLGLAAPTLWEGSSWISLLAFLWIPWIAFRWAPPLVRPRWRLLIHVPAVLLFALTHVGGFIALRVLVYRLEGDTYQFGDFVPNFLYEFSKDALSYLLIIATFTALTIRQRLPNQAATANSNTKFAIRDGARITRVAVSDILAVSSAGNYVEFALGDGRRPLMRTPLSAVESELAPHGFVRVHRSWLVNPAQVTALRPDGSGDYTIELGALNVPLSRRFPEALEKLRTA